MVKMIDPKTIERLEGIESDRCPVISLYLNTDLEKTTSEKYSIRVRNLFKEKEKLIATEDHHQIERCVHGQIGHESRGLAVFSCAEKKLFIGVPLPKAPQDGIFFGKQAYLKPLREAFDRFESVMTVFVDRERAELFRYQYGEFSGETVKDRVAGQHDQGGWSQARYQRHIEEEVEKHLEHTAQELFRISRRQPFDEIILVADEPIMARFEKHLHPYLKECVNKRVKKDLLDKNRPVPSETLQKILFD